MLKDFFVTEIINGVEVVSTAELERRNFSIDDVLCADIQVSQFYTEDQIIKICRRVILFDAINRFANRFNLVVDEPIVETWRGVDYVSTEIFHDSTPKNKSRLIMFLLFETFASQYIKAPFSFRDESGTLFISPWCIDVLISMDEAMLRYSQTSQIQNTYVMYNPINDLYKIGKSKNVLTREKALKCAAPEIKLILSCEDDIEAELHDEFTSKRRRGEWFALTANDVLDLIEKYGFKRIDN